MIDPQQFIAEYSEGDEHRIRFAWNGKHGSAFVDSNYEFRKEVLELVLSDLDSADLLLIRDLFRAETECSREAWGIDRRVGQLAEALLRRRGDRYIEDYLLGKRQSFDAALGTSDFHVDYDLAQSLLTAVKKKLDQPNDEQTQELLELGRKVFESWVENTKPKR